MTEATVDARILATLGDSDDGTCVLCQVKPKLKSFLDRYLSTHIHTQRERKRERERERERVISNDRRRLEPFREIIRCWKLEGRKKKKRKRRETSDRRYVKAKQPPVELKEPTAKEKSSKKVGVARAAAGLARPISKRTLRTCNGLPFGHACSPGSPSPFPARR